MVLFVAPVGFPVAQVVKNPPAVWETWVGEIPWRRERLPTPVFWPGDDCIVHGVAKSQTRLSDLHFDRGRGIPPEQDHKYFSVLFETVRRRLPLWLAAASFSVCCRLVL